MFGEGAGVERRCEKRYSLRFAKSVQKHFNNLSTDAQKLVKTLWLVRKCEPTGVTEDQVLSIAVSSHARKYETMFYEQKDFGLFN